MGVSYFFCVGWIYGVNVYYDGVYWIGGDIVLGVVGRLDLW